MKSLPQPADEGTRNRSGRRGALLGALGLAATAALPAVARTAHPDAELITLCAEHIRNRAAYNDHGGYLEPEDCPLWIAYERTCDAISAAKPQTIEGIMAKARAAQAEARMPGGDYEPDYGPAGRWALDLVNDLVRLYGRAV